MSSSYGREAVERIPATCDVCGAETTFASEGNPGGGIVAYRDYACHRMLTVCGTDSKCPKRDMILQERLDTAIAELDSLRADAELGRLVRAMPDGWLLQQWRGEVAEWYVFDDKIIGNARLAMANTPEAALRAAMGEEGASDE